MSCRSNDLVGWGDAEALVKTFVFDRSFIIQSRGGVESKLGGVCGNGKHIGVLRILRPTHPCIVPMRQPFLHNTRRGHPVLVLSPRTPAMASTSAGTSVEVSEASAPVLLWYRAAPLRNRLEAIQVDTGATREANI